MTAAVIGLGVTVSLDNAAGTLTALSEVLSVTPYAYSRDTVEATHLGSTSGHREYIAGLADAGEASVELNHVQESATDQLLQAAIADGVVRTFKVLWVAGHDFSCEGIVTNYSVGSLTPGEKQTASFTIKFTGVPVFTAD